MKEIAIQDPYCIPLIHKGLGRAAEPSVTSRIHVQRIEMKRVYSGGLMGRNAGLVPSWTIWYSVHRRGLARKINAGTKRAASEASRSWASPIGHLLDSGNPRRWSHVGRAPAAKLAGRAAGRRTRRRPPRSGGTAPPSRVQGEYLSEEKPLFSD